MSAPETVTRPATEHRWEPSTTPYGWCSCGRSFRSREDHTAHAANGSAPTTQALA